VTEVARQGPAGTFDTLVQRLDLEATLVTRDRTAGNEWIKEKLVAISEADSVEDINALATSGSLPSSKELIGHTFDVKDFALQESGEQYRENSLLKKMVIIQAVDVDTGEELVFSGGGDTFLTQLIAMRDKFDFPFTGTILGQKTGSGYDMLYWRFRVPKKK
jgi:hypothetical protein